MKIIVEYKSPFIEHEKLKFSLTASSLSQAEEKFIKQGFAPKADIIAIYEYWEPKK